MAEEVAGEVESNTSRKGEEEDKYDWRNVTSLCGPQD